MTELDFGTVERLSFDISQASAVKVITGKRISKMTHMTADLMRSACFYRHATKGMTVSETNRLIMRDRTVTVLAYTTLDTAVYFKRDRHIDRTRLSDNSFTNRIIYLLNGRLNERIGHAILDDQDDT